MKRSKKKSNLISLFLYVIIILFLPTYLLAQNFLDEKLPVAKHQKKNASVKFKLKEKLFGGPNKELGIEDVDLDVPGYIFTNSKLPISAGYYDGLPACKENKTREITRSEDAFRTLDVIVYQFGLDDKKAKSYELKNNKVSNTSVIPYIEGALENPYRPSGDNAQTIIRGLGIKCLPTRVSSVRINGKNGCRYFEGRKACEKASDKK